MMVPSEETCCSLMITTPPGTSTLRSGSPVTEMGTPLIERLSMLEVPTPASPNTARARAMTKSAPMLIPATFRSSAASDASEAILAVQTTLQRVKYLSCEDGRHVARQLRRL